MWCRWHYGVGVGDYAVVFGFDDVDDQCVLSYADAETINALICKEATDVGFFGGLSDRCPSSVALSSCIDRQHNHCVAWSVLIYLPRVPCRRR